MTKATFHIRRLPPTTPPATLEDAGAVLAAAFAGSTFTYVWNGTDPEVAQARMTEFVTTAALDLEAYVAETDDGQIIGVMLVKPPGFEHRKSPNVAGPHADRTAAAVAKYPEISVRVADLVRNVSALKLKAYGEADLTDTYYVSHLGTLPEWKGMGVGAALLRHLNDKLEVTGAQGSLLAISARHADWYARFGYKALADMEIAVSGGTTLHFFAMAT